MTTSADFNKARAHRRRGSETEVTGFDPMMSTAEEQGRTELMLMLLSDARLPTGAHTHSAGLEPALNSGLPTGDVPRYLRARLRTVTAVEAGAAVVARHRATKDGTGAEVAAGLRGVEAAWRARTISGAARQASQQLGRGYQRLVARLWPLHPAALALAELSNPCRAVVLGVAAACAGIGPAALARLVGYDEAQTICAAALKISPFDPVTATQWALAAQPEIERLAAAVSDLTRPEDIPAASAPLMEQWAEIHATTTQRLFRA